MIAIQCLQVEVKTPLSVEVLAISTDDEHDQLYGDPVYGEYLYGGDVGVPGPVYSIQWVTGNSLRVSVQTEPNCECS